MRILVTGSSGFIGSHVVDKLLGKNHEVIGIDLWFNNEDLKHQLKNSNFKFVKGDILNEYLVKPLIEKSDVIIHLAAILGTSETIEKYDVSNVVKTNILGTVKILKWASENGVERVIVPSVPDVPWLNPYRITKNTMENFALLFHKYYKLNTIVLKLGNVYGPRERWINSNFGAPYNYQKAVPTFIVNALQNKSLPIYGDGKQMSDYIHINDIVEAFLKSIDSSDAIGHVIPIGRGKSISVNELANLIIKLTGSKSSKKYMYMRKGETHLSICIDTSLAMELLKFKAKIDVIEGLKMTIPYYKRKLAIKDEKRAVSI